MLLLYFLSLQIPPELNLWSWTAPYLAYILTVYTTRLLLQQQNLQRKRKNEGKALLDCGAKEEEAKAKFLNVYSSCADAILFSNPSLIIVLIHHQRSSLNFELVRSSYVFVLSKV